MQSEILSHVEQRKFYTQSVSIMLECLALFNRLRTQNVKEVFKRSSLTGKMDRKQSLRNLRS